MTKTKAKKTTKVTKKTKVIFNSSSRKALKPDKKAVHMYPLFIKLKSNFKPWIINKTAEARKLSKHSAARAAARFGAPAGVALIIILTLISLISPKTDFQKAKERLAKNPNDFEAHLILAEEFLKNNQFEEAERILRLAQQIKVQRFKGSKVQNKNVLGEKADAKLEELWENKHYSDLKDIRKLIAAWEKILEEKPGYRDGHLQLALLYYKIYEDEKAKEHLEKAIEIDPNYEMARELEKVISN